MNTTITHKHSLGYGGVVALVELKMMVPTPTMNRHALLQSGMSQLMTEVDGSPEPLVTGSESSVKWYCVDCKKTLTEVDAKNLYSTCSRCDESHPVSELKTIERWRALCPSCVESLYSDRPRVMRESVSNIMFNKPFKFR